MLCICFIVFDVKFPLNLKFLVPRHLSTSSEVFLKQQRLSCLIKTQLFHTSATKANYRFSQPLQLLRDYDFFCIFLHTFEDSSWVAAESKKIPGWILMKNQNLIFKLKKRKHWFRIQLLSCLLCSMTMIMHFHWELG